MPKTNLNNGEHRAEKRKSSRLKNLWNRIVERKKAALAKLSKPKGTTITGPAKDQARRVMYGQSLDRYSEVQDIKPYTRNQRKRRKLERQTGIRRK